MVKTEAFANEVDSFIQQFAQVQNTGKIRAISAVVRICSFAFARVSLGDFEVGNIPADRHYSGDTAVCFSDRDARDHLPGRFPAK